ncbi:MAG: cation transporter [Actinobacteria bacterium]|nr:cation transporter [Actinomycetota bacterium]
MAQKTVKFKTRGMVCTACEMLIESSLSSVDGVEEVSSDYAKELTTVTYEEERVELGRLFEKFERAGYEATVA